MTEVTFFLICAFIIICIIIFGSHELIFWDDGAWIQRLFRKRKEYKDALNSSVNRYSWSFECKKLKEYPTITFSQFQDFYYVNPNSWQLYEYFVKKDNDRNLIMIFEYPEWKKYNKFCKQLEKDKEAAKENKKKQEIIEHQNEVTRRILESVQRDIDAIRAENEKNFNDAADLIKGVKL